MEENIVTIISLILGSSVVSSIVTAFASKRRNNADTAKAIGDAWKDLLGPMETRLRENNDEIIKLRKRIDELECSGAEKDRTINAQAIEIERLTGEMASLRKHIEELEKSRTRRTRRVKGE